MTHEEIKSKCLEYIDNEPLDIVDVYGDDAVAEAAADLIEGLMPSYYYLYNNSFTILEGDGGKIQLKALNNAHGSRLSVSNESETCVSESLVYIIRPTKQLHDEDVATMLDMINEAWYGLVNY